jgi:hypothetical protein
VIRKETAEGWLLVTHGEHARLAGLFADAWGNAEFEAPGPRDSVRTAIYSHDDGWADRDARPFLTRAGIPEAFTRELVGTYAAFEEIDLPSYLRVRGEATAAVAARDLYAAIIVSMHTVNLLTEQADVSTIRHGHRALHAEFVAAQRAFQIEATARLGAHPAALDRAFKFLQCCDNLSLIACADYPKPRALRHAQPDRGGQLHALQCTPMGDGVYRLAPFPFSAPRQEFSFNARLLRGQNFPSTDAYRAALLTAPLVSKTITLLA